MRCHRIHSVERPAVKSSRYTEFIDQETKMMTKKTIGCAFAVMLIAQAWAGETTIVRDVLGPEGPLFIDGNLYYVGWISNTLSKWDGKTSTILNHTEGCGHNGLALTKRKRSEEHTSELQSRRD